LSFRASGALRLRGVLLPVFFLSGFAALLYQIVWQRLLSFFSGADVYSVTLIVTAYMAGLGFGSLLGGQVADRLSARGRLLAFAAAELAVGLFALVSVDLLYRRLFLGFGERELPLAVTSLLLFALLLWPTFFMGASLPLLARFVTESPAAAARRVGRLYGWNTLGAAVGALATVWWLVRAQGFEGAIRVGALLNFGCAGAALLLLLRRPAGPEQPSAVDREGPAPVAATALPFRTWLVIYALSGFVALSLEIVWFRVLGTILKSSSFTFATLLALYLAGLGLGALVGSRLAARSRRPAAVFFALQAAVPLYAALSLALLLAGLGRLPFLDPVAAHLGQYDPLKIDAAIRATTRFVTGGGDASAHVHSLATTFLMVYAAVPAGLILVPTALMGMSFPYLQRQVQTDLAQLGRRVGRLQTANIVGSMAGAGVTGLVLIGWLGTAGTLKALVALGAVFLLLLARSIAAAGSSRIWGFSGAALAATLAVLAVSPEAPALWARLHGTTPERVVFEEDGSGVALVKHSGPPGRPPAQVFVGGLGQSHLPYGGYHAWLGVLPTLVHPRPEAVLVIGLGSGSTLFGAGGRQETRRIDCVEIASAQLPPLRRLAQQPDYPAVAALLADRRVRLVFTDGRTFLMRSRERYDVIEADALRPSSAYAGSLYSVEYFDLLRRRLKPGGLGVTWCPTRRVRDSFLRVFPHAVQIGPTLLGSDRPIAFDAGELRARLGHPFTRSHFAGGGLDAGRLLDEALAEAPVVFGPELDRDALADVNTDLYPKDEYLASVPLLSRKP
jgi:predicted membrane-bound spermidine synthase